MEAQRGSNTDSVQTTSNQTNDSLPLTFTSKDMWTKAYTMGHTVACCSFYNGMFSLLCFLGGELGFFCVFYFAGEVARANDGYEEMSRTEVNDGKLTKSQ